jgi:ABC-2 type transport system ATP-binding protein
MKLGKVYEAAFRGQDVHALKDLDLNVDAGEIYGYLGPNGSGKTTTIKLLLGLIFPTSGSIRILGRSDTGAVQVRQNIGYLPEGAYYPDFLKGEEVLRFYGQLYGLYGSTLRKRVDETLEMVGMNKARKRLIKGYSKGMRQRIGMAQALLNDPQILILDEPTTGLDPIARKDIRDILVRLRDAGKTLLISSHELLEVELISNRVGILYEGVLRRQGTMDELLTEREITVRVDGLTPEKVDVLTRAGIQLEDTAGAKGTLRLPAATSLYSAMDLCKSHGITVSSVAPRRETLEELFVRVIREAGREEAVKTEEAAV